MADALIQLFADVLEVEPARLNDDSSPDTVSQWDSLSAMHLMLAMETKFKVAFSPREIMEMAMSTIGFARMNLRRKHINV